MRLPWNKKYMEIGFHVILTVLLLVGMLALLLRLPTAKNVILQAAGDFLAVFAPVLWSLFLTLLLEPLTAFWQRFYESLCSEERRRRIRNRQAGTILTYLSVGGFLFFTGSLLARKIGHTNLPASVEQINGYIRQAGDMLVLFHLKLAEMGVLQNVEGILEQWTNRVTLWLQESLLRFTEGLPRLGGSLLDILLGGTAAFYFLMEKERLQRLLGAWCVVLCGNRVTRWARCIFHEVYTVFSGYLSGQLLDACVMAVLFSAAFCLVGLPHGILLGAFSGFSNFIPYFGAVVAFLLAAFAGLLSGMPLKAVYAAILILLLQQIDSIFIVPRVVGRRVELHPVLVLFSLAIFGRLFGFWGLLLAVPIGALCKKILLWCYYRKKSDISF